MPHPIWRHVQHALLDFLFPPRCVVCSHEDMWFCHECYAKVRFIEPDGERGLLSANTPPWLSKPLDSLHSVAFSEGPLRKAIHAFKYQGARVLAPDLGEMLYAYWLAHIPPTDMIVPVPLHPRRRRQRGYNQSELLAKQLSNHADIPTRTDLLVRTRHTTPQVELSAAARQMNMTNAFACAAHIPSGTSILLIDDVCTTGSTLNACATALHAQNVGPIHALTLGHAV